MIPPNIFLYHEYEKYPGSLTDTSAEMVSLPKSTKQSRGEDFSALFEAREGEMWLNAHPEYLQMATKFVFFLPSSESGGHFFLAAVMLLIVHHFALPEK